MTNLYVRICVAVVTVLLAVVAGIGLLYSAAIVRDTLREQGKTELLAELKDAGKLVATVEVEANKAVTETESIVVETGVAEPAEEPSISPNISALLDKVREMGDSVELPGGVSDTLKLTPTEPTAVHANTAAPERTFASVAVDFNLGAAKGNPIGPLGHTSQAFEKGSLHWIEGKGILAIFADSFGEYPNEWEPGQDLVSCDEVASLAHPVIMGFGKTLCNNPELRDALGSPKGPEIEDTKLEMQKFDGGFITRTADGEFAVFHGGAWEHLGK